MKPVNCPKRFHKPLVWRLSVLAAVFFIAGAFDCAALGSTQNQEAGIQGIIEQWMAIERRFVEASVFSGEGTEFSFEEFDSFLTKLKAFNNSEAYRIFRTAPFSYEVKNIFGPFPDNEIPEIRSVSGLVLAFNEAVLKGETENAMLISADISSDLVRALIRSGEAEQFAYDAYLRLLFVFIGFIALTAFIIMLLYKALGRSFKREAESSWFSQAVLLAHEEERARLSRELHDTVAQDLRWLSLGMDKIVNCPDAVERENLCNEAAAAHSVLMRKVRDICDFLVPPDFRFQGLGDASRRLCLDFGKRTGINCRIDISENLKLDSLNEEKQLQIFRIVQEALTNVEKHSGAREAIVILRSGPDGTVSVGISDDGRGFRPPGAKDLQTLAEEGAVHLGIRGMNERAAILGGRLLIKSEPGEGTLICLELPSGYRVAAGEL